MRPLVRLSFVLLGTVALAAPALAGPHVPDVSAERLPVAGTCAPIPSTDRTWVTLGDRGFFRIDRDPTDVDAQTLQQVLADRAKQAAAAGRTHDVWMVMPADQEWGGVVSVLGTCQQVGLTRVGIEVRAESGDGLFGFPLFLPYGRPPAANGTAGTARKLEVRLETRGDKPSYMPRLYLAAEAAIQHFQPVVAEVSVGVRTKAQDAIQAIDLLYRAGCAAVRMKYRMMVDTSNQAIVPQVWVEDAVLPPDPMPVQVPPIRPRKTPWPDDGAAEPGAFQLVLEPIPNPGRDKTPQSVVEHPLPSYAARGGEVPASAFADAQTGVLAWSGVLGGWLDRIVTDPELRDVPGSLFVKRRRQGLGVTQLFKEAREAFPQADGVVPATIRVQAYLTSGVHIVGKVDVTLATSGDRMEVVYANWVVERFPDDLTLPPVETEPFAAGVPGRLRVVIEGLLAAARARGPGALPLASEATVLQYLPAVAHASVRPTLARRKPAIDALAGWLRATPYDRVFVAVVDGQASVRSKDGRVIGVLRYALEGENGDLALASLDPRVATR